MAFFSLSSSRGFTLDEAVFLVVIVGFLRAIAIHEFDKIRMPAAKAARVNEGGQLPGTSVQYFFKFGFTLVSSRRAGAIRQVENLEPLAGRTGLQFITLSAPITVPAAGGARRLTYSL